MGLNRKTGEEPGLHEGRGYTLTVVGIRLLCWRDGNSRAADRREESCDESYDYQGACHLVTAFLFFAPGGGLNLVRRQGRGKGSGYGLAKRGIFRGRLPPVRGPFDPHLEKLPYSPFQLAGDILVLQGSCRLDRLFVGVQKSDTVRTYAHVVFELRRGVRIQFLREIVQNEIRNLLTGPVNRAGNCSACSGTPCHALIAPSKVQQIQPDSDLICSLLVFHEGGVRLRYRNDGGRPRNSVAKTGLLDFHGSL